MADVKAKLVKSVSEGNALIGSKSIVDELLNGELTHVVLSANCPKKERDSIVYYCMLSKTPVTVMSESSVELGSILGKPYPVSAAAVE